MMIRVKSAIALLTRTYKKADWAEVEQIRLKLQIVNGREITFGEAFEYL